jgi:hypothetical protein
LLRKCDYGAFGAIAAESIFIVESIFIIDESMAPPAGAIAGASAGVVVAGAAIADVSAVSVFDELQAASEITATARAKRFILYLRVRK